MVPFGDQMSNDKQLMKEAQNDNIKYSNRKRRSNIRNPKCYIHKRGSKSNQFSKSNNKTPMNNSEYEDGILKKSRPYKIIDGGRSIKKKIIHSGKNT
jgi:hypothetical protein